MDHLEAGLIEARINRLEAEQRRELLRREEINRSIKIAEINFANVDRKTLAVLDKFSRNGSTEPQRYELQGRIFHDRLMELKALRKAKDEIVRHKSDLHEELSAAAQNLLKNKVRLDAASKLRNRIALQAQATMEIRELEGSIDLNTAVKLKKNLEKPFGELVGCSAVDSASVKLDETADKSGNGKLPAADFGAEARCTLGVSHIKDATAFNGSGASCSFGSNPQPGDSASEHRGSHQPESGQQLKQWCRQRELQAHNERVRNWSNLEDAMRDGLTLSYTTGSGKNLELELQQNSPRNLNCVLKVQSHELAGLLEADKEAIKTGVRRRGVSLTRFEIQGASAVKLPDAAAQDNQSVENWNG